MTGKEGEDWKDYLAPDAKSKLAEVLSGAKMHKGAYMHADDVKVAQLWCAVVELKKQVDAMQRVQMQLEEPFQAIVEVGEAEKKKAIERMLREIVRPTDVHTEQATQKLVDSLMKF
ncbi:MAG: hypothetical protein ACYTFW_23255 [Planctomycetota bacterium]|jgi:hypothetical protein